MGFVGIPPTMVYGRTSFVTTVRVPIIAPSPIVTLARITALYPIHTSLPTTISHLLSHALVTFFFSRPHSSKNKGNRYVDNEVIIWFALLKRNFAL